MSRIVLIDTGRRIYASADEAFADEDRHTVRYACAIERPAPPPRQPLTDRIVMWACAAALVAYGLLDWLDMLPGK